MPKLVDKDEKQLQIIYAALQVFAQKGIGNTRMIEIAEKAGIGKGTIYEYFRSKEEIFLAAFRQHVTEYNSNLEILLNQYHDPQEKLRILIKHILPDFLDNSGEFAGIMMDVWAEGIRNKDEKILQAINLKQIYTQYRNQIAGILDQGVVQNIFKTIDTQALASVIIGALDGVMLQWIVDRKTIDIHRVSDVLLDTILAGLLKQVDGKGK
jgi:TetR/AcrR family fatty acid metabolism transcriptional regulator